MLRFALVLWPLLVLPGCITLGPDFNAPAWTGPTSWFKGSPPKAPVSQATEAPIDLTWWIAFKDPTLTALENRVAGENLDVAIAGLRIEESRAQYNAAMAAGFPQLNSNLSFTRQKASNVGVFANAPTALGASGASGSTAGGLGSRKIHPFDVFQLGFDASWEIDLWGKVRRSVESAEATVVASEDSRRGVLLTTMAEVARDYIALRGVQTELRIAHENVQTARENLNLTQQRASGGVTTTLDVANASAQLSTTLALIPSLEAREAELINALSLLLGMPPGGLRAELASPKAIPPVPPSVPAGIPSELARRRPDVRAAEANLHATTADIGVSKAAFFPTFKLGGSVGLQSVLFSKWFTGNALQYAVGSGLSVPIFEGGQLKAQVMLSEAKQQEAALSYQQTVLRALHEADDALTAYRFEQRRRQELTAAVAESRKALQLAQARYAQGVSDFLAVLDAQRTTRGTELLLVQSTTAVSADLVALCKALGGGWEATFPETNTASAEKP